MGKRVFGQDDMVVWTLTQGTSAAKLSTMHAPSLTWVTELAKMVRGVAGAGFTSTLLAVDSHPVSRRWGALKRLYPPEPPM